MSTAPTGGWSPRTRMTAQAAHVRTGTRWSAMPPRSTSTVARPWLPSKKQVAGRPLRCSERLDESVQPGAQAADQPLGLVEIVVRPGLDALARGAADARAHLGDDVERALVLARDGLVVALGDDIGERRDLLGDAAAARDEDPAAVGDVAQARARASAAGAQAQQREDEHEDADRGEHPDPGAAPGARRGGGGGGEGGGGDRRNRECPRARGARAGAGMSGGWSRT